MSCQLLFLAALQIPRAFQQLHRATIMLRPSYSCMMKLRVIPSTPGFLHLPML